MREYSATVRKSRSRLSRTSTRHGAVRDVRAREADEIRAWAAPGSVDGIVDFAVRPKAIDRRLVTRAERLARSASVVCSREPTSKCPLRQRHRARPRRRHDRPAGAPRKEKIVSPPLMPPLGSRASVRAGANAGPTIFTLPVPPLWPGAFKRRRGRAPRPRTNRERSQEFFS